MKKTTLLSIVILLFSFAANSQLMVSKLVGKNSKNSKLGFGAFLFYDFPINEEGTNSIRLELIDLAYYPRKDDELSGILGYISVKLGYKYTFSETKTGFYLEPQAGYCRVVRHGGGQEEAIAFDGAAAALEGGYSFEVGENGNSLNLGLKFERAFAGEEASISSVGFRVSYSFGLFKRRGD